MEFDTLLVLLIKVRLILSVSIAHTLKKGGDSLQPIKGDVLGVFILQFRNFYSPNNERWMGGKDLPVDMDMGKSVGNPPVSGSRWN